VYSLSATVGGLYVAGAFHLPGDTNLYGLARWDGHGWENFGSVVGAYPGYSDPAMQQVVVQEPNLYVLGSFQSVAGLPLEYSAQWTGTNWAPLFPLPHQLWALTLHQGRLHGSFYTAANPSTPFTGWWDGTNWQSLGAGLNDVADQLLSDGTNLFAVGGFTNSGATLLDHVARWDGTNWWPLGTSVWARGQWPYRLALDDSGRLYGLGYFQSVQGKAAGGVAGWDGQEWSAIGPSHALGLQGSIASVYALATNSGRLYVSGIFTFAGHTPADSVAVLESNRWSAVGQFTVSNRIARIRTLAAAGNDLFVGGTFTNVDGLWVQNVAHWNGQQWSDLGGGLNSNVYALTVLGSNVVAGGDFTQAGSTNVAFLAAWDGTDWSPLGEGVDAPVRALTVANGRLYAGGRFTNAGGVLVNHVAAWEGGAWRALGEGVAGSNVNVLALAVGGNRVVAGGQFQLAGGRPANNVALWNGSEWTPLGEGAENGVSGGAVYAVAIRGSNIYVGGTFTNAGTVSARGLACWDGARWSRLGSGINNSVQRPRVFAMALDEHALLVGGLIHSAGNKGVSGLARWVDEPRLTLGAPRLIAGGATQVPLTGACGLRIALQLSSDLDSWRTCKFVEALEDAILLDAPAEGARQFYQGRLDP
jgi:hypothetical protein